MESALRNPTRRLTRPVRRMLTWLLLWWWCRTNGAVIVDVETSDLEGKIIEICVMDMRGQVLVDTRIDPGPGVVITPEAFAVHQISATDLVGAPTIDQAADRVLAATAGKTVIAYNAHFDQGRVEGEIAASVGRRWFCLMRARSRLERCRWKRLEGNHQARGDCEAARQLAHRLVGLTAPGGA